MTVRTTRRQGLRIAAYTRHPEILSLLAPREQEGMLALVISIACILRARYVSGNVGKVRLLGCLLRKCFRCFRFFSGCCCSSRCSLRGSWWLSRGLRRDTSSFGCRNRLLGVGRVVGIDTSREDGNRQDDRHQPRGTDGAKTRHASSGKRRADTPPCCGGFFSGLQDVQRRTLDGCRTQHAMYLCMDSRAFIPWDRGYTDYLHWYLDDVNSCLRRRASLSLLFLCGLRVKMAPGEHTSLSKSGAAQWSGNRKDEEFRA